jgi:intein/homing endonuclease
MTKWSLPVENSDALPMVVLDTEIPGKMGSLEDLLIHVINKTLNQIFREEGANVIYDFLENKSHVKREDISSKTEVFSAGLRELLSSGAPVIEKLILKNLYHQLGLKFVQKKGHGFSDYIEELMERF